VFAPDVSRLALQRSPSRKIHNMVGENECMATRQNIVLVTLDALRADHLSSYGYSQKTSPFLDRFEADAVRFSRAYSASSHTREAIPAILTGKYPDSAVDGNFQRNADTVATSLSSEGYASAGFHSNPFVSRAYDFDQGFDTFDDDLRLGQNKLLALAQRALDKFRNRHYARADEINERSLSWLDNLNSDQPFFLWNHYMDPHGPYEAPAEYQQRFHGEVVSGRAAQKLYHRAIDDPESITDDERQRLVDLYDAEIAYTDDLLKAFFGELRQRELLEETLVILTADHGDAFGEHGYYEHPRYLQDELVHVPLIISGPNLEPATINSPASTLDVVPTILSAARISTEGLPGQDLREMATPADQFSDRTVISQARGENGNRHVRRFSARQQSATVYAEYDVNTEIMNLSNNAENESLAEDLQAHIVDHTQSEIDIAGEVDDEVDKEIEDRLSALGYK